MALPLITNEQQFDQLSGVRSDVSSADAFGADVAASIGQLGDVVGRIGQEMRQRHEEKLANEAIMKVNQWSIDAIHGVEGPSGNRIPGLLEMEGDDAGGITRKYRQNHSEMVEEATKNFNPRTRAAVVNTLTRSAMADNERLADHEATQLRKGTMASNMLLAQSFENKALKDPISDADFNINMDYAAAAMKTALGRSEKPGDVEKYIAGMVKARVEVLSNLARADPTDMAITYFAKANEILIKDTRINEDDRAKMEVMVAMSEKSWRSNRNELDRSFKSQLEFAKNAYRDSLIAKATNKTTEALAKPDSDLAVLIEELVFGEQFNYEDKEVQSAVQSQVEHLLTAQANRNKPTREFPQYSSEELVKKINSLLYVRQGDPGVALRMIEEAASGGELSQADYLRFTSEAASKRSDQVNRALQTIIPKFWELEANRGVKRVSENKFYYPMFPIESGTRASKVGIGDRMGGLISISRLGRRVEYARATPMELKQLVDDIKQYCMEHPEVDTKTVAVAILKPVELEIASQNLLDRLPYVINSLTPAIKKDQK